MGSFSSASASGVGMKLCVMRLAQSHSSSTGGERRTSSATRCRLEPAVRYGHSSQTEASKARPARCVARSFGRTS